MKDLAWVKPSQEGCVYLLHFAVTTNPAYVPKVECTENLFRSLFDLRSHLGSTVAPTALQEALEKPPLPVL